MNLLNKFQPDKQIENYAFSLNACIGKGSSGTVYIGRNQVSNEIVAIKAIDMRSLKTDYAWKMLCSEVKIMKKLKHPHVVRLLDVFQTKNNTYIITEFCDQGDLRSYLKKKQCLSEDESIAVCSQIISGLHELATHGIIHRDLKPANILVNNGTFKITDFGFAKKLDSLDDQLMDSLVGTPLYMAPQILHKQQYTSKCDTWSLGLILFELLFSRTPWPAVNVVDLVHKMSTMPLTFPKDPRISQQMQIFLQNCISFQENERMSIQDLCSHPLFERYVQLVLQRTLSDSDQALPESAQELPNGSQPSSLQTFSQKKPPLTNFESATIPQQQQLFPQQLQQLKQQQNSGNKQQQISNNNNSKYFSSQSPARNTQNQANPLGTMSPFQQHHLPQFFMNNTNNNNHNNNSNINISKGSIHRRDVSLEQISPLRPQLKRVSTTEVSTPSQSHLRPAVVIQQDPLKQGESNISLNYQYQSQTQQQQQGQFAQFSIPSPYSPISPMRLNYMQTPTSTTTTTTTSPFHKKSYTLPEQQLIGLTPKYSAPVDVQFSCETTTPKTNNIQQFQNISGINQIPTSTVPEILGGTTRQFSSHQVMDPQGAFNRPIQQEEITSYNNSNPNNKLPLQPSLIQGRPCEIGGLNPAFFSYTPLSQQGQRQPQPSSPKPLKSNSKTEFDCLDLNPSPMKIISRTALTQNQKNSNNLFEEVTATDGEYNYTQNQAFVSQRNNHVIERETIQSTESKGQIMKQIQLNLPSTHSFSETNAIKENNFVLKQHEQEDFKDSNNYNSVGDTNSCKPITNNNESPCFQRKSDEEEAPVQQQQQQHNIINPLTPQNSSFFNTSKNNNGDSPDSRKHKISSSINSNGLLSTKSGSVNPNSSQPLDEKQNQDSGSLQIPATSSNQTKEQTSSILSSKKEFEPINIPHLVINHGHKKTISLLELGVESSNSSNKGSSISYTPQSYINRVQKTQDNRDTSPSKPPTISIPKRLPRAPENFSNINNHQQISPNQPRRRSEIVPILPMNLQNYSSCNDVDQNITNPLPNIRKWSDNSFNEEAIKRNPLHQHYPSNIPSDRSNSLQGQEVKGNIQFKKAPFPQKQSQQSSINEQKFSASETKRHLHINHNKNNEPRFFENAQIIRQPRSTSFKEERQWASFASETPQNLPSSNIQSPLKTKPCFAGSAVSPVSGKAPGYIQIQDFSGQEKVIETMIQLIRTVRLLRNQVESILSYSLNLDSPLLMEKLNFLLNRYLVIQSSMLKISIFDKGINILHLDRWIEFKNSEKWPCLYQRVMGDYLEIVRVASINQQKSRDNLDFQAEAKKDFNFGKVWRQTHAQAAAGEEDNTNFYFYVYQLLKQAVKEIYWRLESRLTNSGSPLNSDDAVLLNCLGKLVDFHQLLKLIISKKEDLSAILKSTQLHEILKEKTLTHEYFAILKHKMCLYDLISLEEQPIQIMNNPNALINKSPISY